MSYKFNTPGYEDKKTKKIVSSSKSFDPNRKKGLNSSVKNNKKSFVKKSKHDAKFFSNLIK